MSLDVTYGDTVAVFAARPQHGRPVVFMVREKDVNVSRSRWSAARMASRFVVTLKGSTGAGFSTHTTFEAACQSALSRARRYDRAYSTPRGTEVAS